MISGSNLLRNILCFAIALLLSFTELQFFEDVGVFSAIFAIILLLTLPTVYLYILPKQDTVLIFLYNIILVFILDLLGRNVNIALFLVSLFCVCLLLCQSIFTENAKRFKAEKAPFTAYVLILVAALAVVSAGAYVIYEYIMKPNMNDKFELSLIYEQSQEQNVEKPNAGAGEGGGGQKREIDFLRIIVTGFIIAVCLMLLYVIYRIMKYAVWLMKTKKSPNNELVRRIYAYILDSLGLYGIGKISGATPYEYLAVCSESDLPVSKTEMEFLTGIFVETYYGKKEAEEAECKRCMKFLHTVSGGFKKSLGMRRYLFEYLLKKRITEF